MGDHRSPVLENCLENPGIVPRARCNTGNHCGRGQLPQSRACGASQHAADAVAAAREPGVVPPVQRAGTEIYRSTKSSRLHGYYPYKAPSRGNCPRSSQTPLRLRELPSTVAQPDNTTCLAAKPTTLRVVAPPPGAPERAQRAERGFPSAAGHSQSWPLCTRSSPSGGAGARQSRVA